MAPTLPNLAVPSPMMPTPTTAAYGAQLREQNGTPVQSNLVKALDAITAVAEQQMAAQGASSAAAPPAVARASTPGSAAKRMGTPATNAGGRFLSAATEPLSMLAHKIKERMTPKSAGSSAVKTPAARPAGEQAITTWLEGAGLGRVHGLLEALLTAAADLDALRSLTDDEVACAISPLRLKASGIKFKKLHAALATLRGEKEAAFEPKRLHEEPVWVEGKLERPLDAPLDHATSVTRVSLDEMPPPIRPRIGDLRMPINPNPPKHRARMADEAQDGPTWKVNAAAEASELADLAQLFGGDAADKGAAPQLSKRPEHSEAAAKAAMLAQRATREVRRTSFVSSTEILSGADFGEVDWLQHGVPLPAPKNGGASSAKGGLLIDESLLQIDLMSTLDEVAEDDIAAMVQKDLDANKENLNPGVSFLNRASAVAGSRVAAAGNVKRASKGAKSARFKAGGGKSKKDKGSKSARAVDRAAAAAHRARQQERAHSRRGGRCEERR